MHFEPGAIPPESNKAGRAAFKKAIINEIKILGGRPKETQGVPSLREMYSHLVAKKRLAEEKK